MRIYTREDLDEDDTGIVQRFCACGTEAFVDRSDPYVQQILCDDCWQEEEERTLRLAALARCQATRTA